MFGKSRRTGKKVPPKGGKGGGASRSVPPGPNGPRPMQSFQGAPEDLAYPVNIDALSNFMEEQVPVRRPVNRKMAAPPPDPNAIANALNNYSKELDAIEQSALYNNATHQRPHLANRIQGQGLHGQHPPHMARPGYGDNTQRGPFHQTPPIPDMAEQMFYEQNILPAEGFSVHGAPTDPIAIEPHHFKLPPKNPNTNNQLTRDGQMGGYQGGSAQNMPSYDQAGQPRQKPYGQEANPYQNAPFNTAQRNAAEAFNKNQPPKRVTSLILGGLAGDGSSKAKASSTSSGNNFLQGAMPQAQQNLNQQNHTQDGLAQRHKTASPHLAQTNRTQADHDLSSAGFAQRGRSSADSPYQANIYHAPTPSADLYKPGFSPVWNTHTISPAARAYRDSRVLGIQEPQAYIAQKQAQHSKFGVSPFFSEPVPYQEDDFYDPYASHSQAAGAFGPATERGPSFLSRRKHYSNAPSMVADQSRAERHNAKRPRDDKSKRRAIKTYFGERPVWPFLPLLMGCVGIFYQIERDFFTRNSWTGYKLNYGWEFLISLLLILFALAWRYLVFSRPREDLLDDWIEQDLKRMESRALDILDADKRGLLVDPIVLVGFPDVDALGRTYKSGRYGRDNILRYTPRAVTILCFTLDEIIAYEGAVDLTTGERVYETTREFFYKDIATIGIVKTTIGSSWHHLSKISSLILPWKWGIVKSFKKLLSGRRGENSSINHSKEFFQISLMDGTNIKLVLRDGRMVSEETDEEIPFTTDDKVIRAIREFVIARKNDQMGMTRR